jgi:hypothetical protein
MFGRTTKKQLAQALVALRVSSDMVTRFSSCLDESQSLLARTTALLNQSQADAAEWRRRYEDAQNRPGVVSVCDETKAVNGWTN